VISQPADFDGQEELVSAESVAVMDVPLVADEDIAAAETRSLLESPGGSIALSDLGRLLK